MPELNQGESISYSNIWSQGDPIWTKTCPANWQLQRAKFLFIHLWLIFIHMRLGKRRVVVNCGQFRLHICWYPVYTNVVFFLYIWGWFVQLLHGWFSYIWGKFYTFVEIYTFEGPTVIIQADVSIDVSKRLAFPICISLFKNKMIWVGIELVWEIKKKFFRAVLRAHLYWGEAVILTESDLVFLHCWLLHFLFLYLNLIQFIYFTENYMMAQY